MKKIILFLILIAFSSCKENERLIYANQQEIYFKGLNKDNDSLYVSLLAKEEVSTTEIPIRLLGNLLSSPKKFRTEVVSGKTTAVEGRHYKKLPDYYEFPADSFEYKMPIVMIKGDEAIKEKAAILTLRLVGTEELGIAYEDRSTIRVIIADMLKTPTGTGYYDDMTAFKSLFGDYSKTKHMMIIELVGHDLWDKEARIYDQKAYFTPYARLLYKKITSDVYEDENGNIMQGWNVP